MNKLFLIFLVVMSTPVFGDQPSCKKLEPISTPAPEYPSYEQAKEFLPGTQYLHVFVEGFVVVKFTVDKSGYVKEAHIVSSENRPSRSMNKSFDGFLEMNVLPTIKKWRYKPIDESCIHVQKLSFKMNPNA